LTSGGWIVEIFSPVLTVTVPGSQSSRLLVDEVVPWLFILRYASFLGAEEASCDGVWLREDTSEPNPLCMMALFCHWTHDVDRGICRPKCGCTESMFIGTTSRSSERNELYFVTSVQMAIRSINIAGIMSDFAFATHPGMNCKGIVPSVYVLRLVARNRFASSACSCGKRCVVVRSDLRHALQ
jgi:hypothetical protein